MFVEFANSFLYRTYLDKSVSLTLNKNRKVTGALRGYDQFMNLVLGNAVEEGPNSSTNKLGMVVSDIGDCFLIQVLTSGLFQVIRGNSIVQIELVGA